MKEKVIIHISREHGSLGHVVGEKLAEKLKCNLYDKKLIEEIAEEHGLDKEFLKEYEEKPKRSLLYRLAQGVSADLEEELTKQVFEKIRRSLKRSAVSPRPKTEPSSSAAAPARSCRTIRTWSTSS